MEITAETIKQHYPAVWWQIYRLGYSQAQSDPNVQEQAARKHLERTLTRPEGASTMTQPVAQTRPVTISVDQRKVNQLLGVSNEAFLKYAQQ